MIKIENLDEIYTWNIKTLWDCLNSADHEELQDYKEEIQLIKNGIDIKVHISYLTEEWYKEYPETKRVSIPAYGKWDLTLFQEELQKRKNFIRRIILELSQTDEIIEQRT